MWPPIPLENLPTLNASINAVCAVLITTGFVMIKKRRIEAHKACMLTACVLSVIFLASYITYHSQAGVTLYPGEGAIRSVYFTILISHTILAVMTLPLVLVTVFFAWRGSLDRHRRIAKVTFPVWLYISVTGVIIYLMLYHLPGGVGQGA